MKKVIVFLFLAFSLQSLAAVIVMPRVDVKLFVNKGRTDFDSIYNPNRLEVRSVVEWLFENNIIDHDYSKAVNPDLKFGPYWEKYDTMWNLVDLDRDGNEELIFSGKPLISEDKEIFSLYAKYGEIWKEVFWDDGHVMAYKKHPNTGEIILFHHRYPCCSQFTHMIQRVRWLKNRLHSTKRYFLARDTAMKGDFFPTKVKYPKKYKRLKKKTMLRWSGKVINTGAARFSPSNQIINFPKDSYYQVLYVKGRWRYIMMVSPPVMEESMVANPSNLKESRFYGWIII